MNAEQPDSAMPESKKLVRFLVAPTSDGDPLFVMEFEDGARLAMTASFEQIEDMADILDEILDAAQPGDEPGLDQLPAFVRRRAVGLVVAAAVCVVDRLAGGGAAIAEAAGAPFRALVTIDELYPDRPDRDS